MVTHTLWALSCLQALRRQSETFPTDNKKLKKADYRGDSSIPVTSHTNWIITNSHVSPDFKVVYYSVVSRRILFCQKTPVIGTSSELNSSLCAVFFSQTGLVFFPSPPVFSTNLYCLYCFIHFFDLVLSPFTCVHMVWVLFSQKSCGR